MSLQIYAYSGLTLVPGGPHDLSEDTPARTLRALVNSDFPGRCEELIHGHLYSYVRCVQVLSMSYGGYNDFREWLAKIAGYPVAPREGRGMRHDAGCWEQSVGPLWELINFADNEGCIGSGICQKLATDFAQIQERSDSQPAVESYFFRNSYNTLRLGVELAANSNGCLEFS